MSDCGAIQWKSWMPPVGNVVGAYGEPTVNENILRLVERTTTNQFTSANIFTYKDINKYKLEELNHL